MIQGGVFHTELPSWSKRDALCINIVTPSTPSKVLRLFTVHLDSLDAQFRRMLQMKVLSDSLHESGCSGGIIAGDFNANDPSDHALVYDNKLVDAWVALKSSTAEGGAT